MDTNINVKKINDKMSEGISFSLDVIGFQSLETWQEDSEPHSVDIKIPSKLVNKMDEIASFLKHDPTVLMEMYLRDLIVEGLIKRANDYRNDPEALRQKLAAKFAVEATIKHFNGLK